MGIREDAVAAHAKVVEEREAAAKVKAEREAVEHDGEKKKTTILVSDWAQEMGYGGQAVISDIKSERKGEYLISTVLFQIDDVDFFGTRASNQKLTVKLADDRSMGTEITNLDTLGRALADAKRREQF